jgi:hypothetical protein
MIAHGPARSGDIRASIGSPTMAASLLGFSAATSLSEGLRATIEAADPLDCRKDAQLSEKRHVR